MYWMACYFIEVIKLYMAIFFLAGYGTKWEKRRAGFLLLYGVAAVIIAVAPLGIKQKTGVVTLLILLTIVTLLQRLGDWTKVVCTYLIIGLSDAAFAGVFCSVMGWNSNQVMGNRVQDMLLNSLSLIVMLLLIILRKISRILETDIKVDGKIHILLSSLLFFIILIVPIQRKSLDVGNGRFAFEVSWGMIIFLIILLHCFYYISKNEKQKVIEKECISLLESQKQYYEKLLIKEQDTRRFRHDIRNHLFVLKRLWDVSSQHKGIEYLQSMLHESNKIGIKVETGNLISNIVVEDVVKAEDGILLEWDGFFPRSTKISDIDLCIIFSNILRNAREEVLNLSEKKISVFIKVWKTSLSIICKNPINKNAALKKEGNHSGLGLENIEKVVKRYGGEMKIEKKEEFIIKIIFYDVVV